MIQYFGFAPWAALPRIECVGIKRDHLPDRSSTAKRENEHLELTSDKFKMTTLTSFKDLFVTASTSNFVAFVLSYCMCIVQCVPFLLHSV